MEGGVKKQVKRIVFRKRVDSNVVGCSHHTREVAYFNAIHRDQKQAAVWIEVLADVFSQPSP